jgi:selenocysteine lyase/cysteine desulfurase
MIISRAQVDRRRFLLRSSLAAAGLCALRNTVPAAGGEEASEVTEAADFWGKVRGQFALAPEVAHLSCFFLVSHPRPVREAIARYREMLDANPFRAVEEGCWGEGDENLVRRVKQAAAEYLGGKPEEVALTQSTTMGLSLVYSGLALRPGDELLTTEHDHYSHQESMRIAAQRYGARVRKITLYDRFGDLPKITEKTIVNRIQQAVTPATRVVGLTWVHSSSGLRLPLRSISAAVRKRSPEALIVVDGVHGLGAIDETVAELGIDVFVSGTHKWIFGPRGTGLVWAPERVWGQMSPFMPTFDGMEPRIAWREERQPKAPARADWFTPGGFHAFEHEWAVADAFEFHRSLGRTRVASRIQDLNSRIKEGLAEMPHVSLWTPRNPALSAGLVGFDVAGLTAEQVRERLWLKKVVASSSPYARSVARLSAGIMNTPEDVEKGLRAVQELKSA